MALFVGGKCPSFNEPFDVVSELYQVATIGLLHRFKSCSS